MLVPLSILTLLVGNGLCINGHQDMPWWEVSHFFRTIYDNGLQAKEIQNILKEDFEWSVKEVNPEELLKEKLKKTEEIFKQHIKAVQKLVQIILDNFDNFVSKGHESHCCERYQENEGGFGCSSGQNPNGGLAVGTPAVVKEDMRNILGIYTLVDNLYFAFEDTSSISFPFDKDKVRPGDEEYCNKYDPTRRPWYRLCKLPKPRDVVLLLDAQAEHSALIFKTASEVIQSLTPEDRFVIVRNYSEVMGGTGRHVDFNVWIVGTDRNKEKSISLIEKELLSEGSSGRDLVDCESLSYSWQDIASQLFDNPLQIPLEISRDPELVVAIISSGIHHICKNSTVKELNKKFSKLGNAVLLFYQIGSLTKQLKETITCQNHTERHYLLQIENEQDLKRAETSFASFFKWQDYIKSSLDFDPLKELKFPVPYNDYFSGENVLSFCYPIIQNGEFKGAACSDVRLINEFESMIQVSGIEEAYGFIVDNQGRALMHPLLPSIHCTINSHCKAPTYELISRLEQNLEVLEVLQGMVDQTQGKKMLKGELVQSLGHAMEGDLSNAVTVRKAKLLYVWSNVNLAGLSLALVFPMEGDKVYRISYKCKNAEKCSHLKFSNYHLDTDEISTSEHCEYFGSVIPDKNRALVKFAPSAFKDAASYRRTLGPHDDIMEAISKGENYSALMKEGNNLNESVVLVNKAENFWHKNPLHCFIGMRYLGTANGVFISYPGVTLNATYDHRERPWYQMTISSRKKMPTIVLSMPYMDYFSRTILQSVAFPIEHKLPSGKSALVGVASGDFSISFLRGRLKRALPMCDGKMITCFLMDSTGYISFHMNSEISQTGLHIIELDPSIAKQLFENKLLRRKGCHDYQRDSIFLYWEFKMPYNERRFVTTDFSIYEIPYMNIFLVAHSHIFGSDTKEYFTDRCRSSCLSTLDRPCRVTSETKPCQRGEKDDLRKVYNSLPACWPTEKSPRKESKHPCVTPTVPPCYLRETQECKLWLPVCYRDGISHR